MELLLKDVRYGIRNLLKRPGFTVVALITLAIGIGANTAIFSVTDKLLLRSLAVRRPEQLVLIKSVSLSPHFVGNAFSYPNFKDYRASHQAFSDLLAFTTTTLELQANDRVERIAGEYVSGNYFDLLGIAAAKGRTFSPDEDKTPGTQPVAVVSDGFWRKHYGADPNLVGQTIVVNDVSLTVIGIAPPNFTGMMLEKPTEMWVPVLMHPQMAQSKLIENRKVGFLQLLGRINDGLSAAEAEARMDVVAQQIKDAHTPPGTITKGLPFSEQHIKFEAGGKGISILRAKFSSQLKLLMAVVGLVLLIACANIGGLLLARGVARRKEMAVRTALGANGWRLARQLLTESFLLAAGGGAIGLLLAPWLVALLINTQAQFDSARPVLSQSVDWRVLAFTTLITGCAGLLFGVLPAWRGSRSGLIAALKEEGGTSGQRQSRFGLRSFLVVGQLSLAIVVLIGAGLCIKSLRNLLAIDPGFQTENVLLVPLELDDKKYDEARAQIFQQQVFERLSALPGVEAASNGSVMPLGGSRSMSSLIVDGHQPLPNEQMAFDANTVGPLYHETMGIKIVKGRGFTAQDQTAASAVIIINEALAQRLFPGEEAVGKLVRSGTGKPPLEIIGIARNIKHHSLTEIPLPHFDTLEPGYSQYTNFVVRVHGRAADLIPQVRRELLELDPSLELGEIKPVSDQIGGALAATRLASTLVAVFGTIALLLASIGLYGVMAWMVSRRTREIGIRMALGARRGDVLTLVIKHGMLLTGLGVALGLGVAFICTQFIENQLYDVPAVDALTFATVALLLSAVALLACYIPARRATKVDPLVALRYE